MTICFYALGTLEKARRHIYAMYTRLLVIFCELLTSALSRELLKTILSLVNNVKLIDSLMTISYFIGGHDCILP